MARHRRNRSRIASGNPWSAGCAETRTSGAEGGPGRRARSNPGTAPRSDPYTKLRGPGRGIFYQLYVLIDIYSRFNPSWIISPVEDSQLATDFIAEAIDRNGTAPHTVHADRGTSMTSKPVSALLADLGVTRSHSRPHVSNDNPYSEAQFKTLKYLPEFPASFASLAHARQFCADFFHQYNYIHRHSGIAWHTPASVHFGTSGAIDQARQNTLTAAWHAHPGRFSRRPHPPVTPAQSWINQPVLQPTE